MIQFELLKMNDKCPFHGLTIKGGAVYRISMSITILASRNDKNKITEYKTTLVMILEGEGGAMKSHRPPLWPPQVVFHQVHQHTNQENADVGPHWPRATFTRLCELISGRREGQVGA